MDTSAYVDTQTYRIYSCKKKKKKKKREKQHMQRLRFITDN